ncbi:MAG TPA: molybdate ABC transporter substrate-binding protein [Sedimenticola thiotaurini]|uniref:Molybdate ABC transporter substrate-binding protein n=1 Tax=Sedimenticola thiotaurini TaxID=1543721 RepID=A0A831RLN2_9GAMM|nr:molybdate ABC transporter substrate-binding protein [Sedimenticola thiotaurini]
MTGSRRCCRVAALLLGLVIALPAPGGQIDVAVASNFIAAARVLAERFQEVSGHQVRLIAGATGKHYAQIRHGAPFHLFLAADARRPALLEQAGLVQPDGRFTYAIGRLVLWSPDPGLVDGAGSVLERRGAFRHLAIANPKLAPYGRAARETLQALGLWRSLQGRLVRGENIGQAYQFVRSGTAQLGLVALSQLRADESAPEGSRWLVPERLHAPIEQQAVLLRDTPAARGFLAFMRSDEGRALIRRFGYEVGDAG